MRYLFYTVTFCCFLLFGTVTVVKAEEITNFTATLAVQPDGRVIVTETIDYNFGAEQKHGIFRILNTNHPQPASVWYKKRSIDIVVTSVTADAQSAPYRVSPSSGSLEVKIGDANQTITGVHRYEIVYEMAGALSYGSSGVELYYNVTGNDWPVPITKVIATVTDPTGVLLASRGQCYYGALYATKSCARATTTTAAVFTADNLGVGEGVTIAQLLQPNHVAVLVHEVLGWQFALSALGAVWIMGLAVWAWRFHRKYKVTLPMIAQYEPYPGVLPLYMGVLYDAKLDPRDVTAGIVYLAEQGAIKIRRTESKVLWLFNITDYEFTLHRPVTDFADPSFAQLLTILFPHAAAVGSTALLSALKGNKTTNSTTYKAIQTSLVGKLRSDGFLAPTATGAIFKVLLLLSVILLVSLAFGNPALLVISIVSFVIIVLAYHNRRTKLGYEARNHLDGFKLFLSVTEAERYKFFNAPVKNPELFMQYLPYAIALGVEQEWATTFAGITIPNPGWYEGGDMAAFSAVAFTSDLGTFSSAFTASSGVQGSSGGGFSGGGGGGGGGGSW